MPGYSEFKIGATIPAEGPVTLVGVKDSTGTAQPISSSNPVPTFSRSETTRIDTVSSSVSYFGFAVVATATSAASWKIIKKDTSGTVDSYLFADGNDSYDNIWDNRAALSYS